MDGRALDVAAIFEPLESFVDGGVVDVNEIVGIGVDLTLEAIAVLGAGGQREE